MSFINRISKLINTPRNEAREDAEVREQLEQFHKDQRLHNRFLIDDKDIAKLTLNSGQVGTVKDLSYGGLAVVFATELSSPFKDLSADHQGRLRIADREIECALRAIRSVMPAANCCLVGFAFKHADGPEALLFLREHLEPMRCGGTLTEVPAAIRNDRFSAPGWCAYHGDGPTDLVTRSTTEGQLLEAMLTCRAKDSYHEVQWRDGQLRTGKSLDKEGTAARMTGGGETSTAILRQALFTLLGAPAPIRSLTLPFYEAISTHLARTAKYPAI